MHTLAIANINTALDGHFCGMLYSKTENGERQYKPHPVGEDTVASPVISQSSNCFIPGKWGRGGGGRGRDEVWDRETKFSQLAKRSPCVMVSG